jgi:hypothetical protein
VPEAVPEVAQDLSGGKRGKNRWIRHVEAYAKRHGMKYGDALKAARASYRKSKA